MLPVEISCFLYWVKSCFAVVAADLVVVVVVAVPPPQQVSLDSRNGGVAVPAVDVAPTIATPELAVAPVTTYRKAIVVKKDSATTVALPCFYSSKLDPSFANQLDLEYRLVLLLLLVSSYQQKETEFPMYDAFVCPRFKLTYASKTLYAERGAFNKNAAYTIIRCWKHEAR